MGLTSLQVCMDSASSDNWLQGTSHEASPGMESPPSQLSPNEVLNCSRPLNMERRLRPPHDQSLKCPRCESTHTKFCYYNNYSLTQPRYFCKTCRRYWTKGGTLRNIPVGGGCRKNKKSSSSKKKNDNESSSSPLVVCHGNDASDNNNNNNNSNNVNVNTTDLQLSFPDQLQFSHITSLFGGGLHHHQHQHHNPSFLPIDFMESKLEGIIGNSHGINDTNNNYDYMGNNHNNNNSNNIIINNNGGDLGMVNLMEHTFHHGNVNNVCAPFGMALLDGNINGNNNGGFMDTCHRLMLPCGESGREEQSPNVSADVKPKLLSLDWQHDVASNNNKDSFRYLNAWSSGMMMNSYGQSSNTNPLL